MEDTLLIAHQVGQRRHIAAQRAPVDELALRHTWKVRGIDNVPPNQKIDEILGATRKFQIQCIQLLER